VGAPSSLELPAIASDFVIHDGATIRDQTRFKAFFDRATTSETRCPLVAAPFLPSCTLPFHFAHVRRFSRGDALHYSAGGPSKSGGGPRAIAPRRAASDRRADFFSFFSSVTRKTPEEVEEEDRRVRQSRRERYFPNRSSVRTRDDALTSRRRAFDRRRELPIASCASHGNLDFSSGGSSKLTANI